MNYYSRNSPVKDRKNPPPGFLLLKNSTPSTVRTKKSKSKFNISSSMSERSARNSLASGSYYMLILEDGDGDFPKGYEILIYDQYYSEYENTPFYNSSKMNESLTYKFEKRERYQTPYKYYYERYHKIDNSETMNTEYKDKVVTRNFSFGQSNTDTFVNSRGGLVENVSQESLKYTLNKNAEKSIVSESEYFPKYEQSSSEKNYSIKITKYALNKNPKYSITIEIDIKIRRKSLDYYAKYYYNEDNYKNEKSVYDRMNGESVLFSYGYKKDEELVSYSKMENNFSYSIKNSQINSRYNDHSYTESEETSYFRVWSQESFPSRNNRNSISSETNSKIIGNKYDHYIKIHYNNEQIGVSKEFLGNQMYYYSEANVGTFYYDDSIEKYSKNTYKNTDEKYGNEIQKTQKKYKETSKNKFNENDFNNDSKFDNERYFHLNGKMTDKFNVKKDTGKNINKKIFYEVINRKEIYKIEEYVVPKIGIDKKLQIEDEKIDKQRFTNKYYNFVINEESERGNENENEEEFSYQFEYKILSYHYNRLHFYNDDNYDKESYHKSLDMISSPFDEYRIKDNTVFQYKNTPKTEMDSHENRNRNYSESPSAESSDVLKYNSLVVLYESIASLPEKLVPIYQKLGTYLTKKYMYSEITLRRMKYTQEMISLLINAHKKKLYVDDYLLEDYYTPKQYRVSRNQVIIMGLVRYLAKLI